MVAVNDDSPRMEWPVGIVIESTKDNDGLVRKVKISMCPKDVDQNGIRKGSCTIIERPMQKLVVLLETQS